LGIEPSVVVGVEPGQVGEVAGGGDVVVQPFSTQQFGRVQAAIGIEVNGEDEFGLTKPIAVFVVAVSIKVDEGAGGGGVGCVGVG